MHNQNNKLKDLKDFLPSDKDLILHLDDSEFLSNTKDKFTNQELSEISKMINKKVHNDYLNYTDSDLKSGIDLNEIKSEQEKKPIYELNQMKKIELKVNKEVKSDYHISDQNALSRGINTDEVTLIKNKKNKIKPRKLFTLNALGDDEEGTKTNENSNFQTLSYDDKYYDLLNMQRESILKDSNKEIKENLSNTEGYNKEDTKKKMVEITRDYLSNLQKKDNIADNIKSTKIKTVNHGISSLIDDSSFVAMNMLNKKRQNEAVNSNIHNDTIIENKNINNLREGKGNIITSTDLNTNIKEVIEEPLVGKGILKAMEIFKQRGYFKDELLLNQPNLNTNISLEYRNEKGKILNPKEAHKEFSQYFHGKNIKPKKIEKALLKEQIFTKDSNSSVNKLNFNMTILRRHNLK